MENVPEYSRMAFGTSPSHGSQRKQLPILFQIGLQTVILERERIVIVAQIIACLLYTSDAADE